MDKEKQIEEMAKDICGKCINGVCKIDGKVCNLLCDSRIRAEIGYDKGYRKINENEVVISKKEYEILMRNKGIEHIQEFSEIDGKLCLVKDKMVLKEYPPDIVKFIRKETAEKILKWLINKRHLFNRTHEIGFEKPRASYLVIDDEIEELAKEFGVDLGEEK